MEHTATNKTNGKKIAAIGETLWDIYGEERYIGGAPANFCCHIAQTEHQAYLLSRVGDDDKGHELVEKLRERNINVDGVQTDIFKPTGTVTIQLDRFGLPAFYCTQNVAFDELRMTSKWEALAPQFDVIFFGMLAQRSQVSAETIHKFLSSAPNALKVFDANVSNWNQTIERNLIESLKHADILKLNQHECNTIKKGLKREDDEGDFLEYLVGKFNLKLAAMTMGELGCMLVTAKERELDPGYYIDAVDSTGAGDAFAAAMVVKYLEGASLKEIADYSNRLAAFVSLQQGATPEWTWEQIDKEVSLRL